MKISDYTYELPEERIAQRPPAERGSSRMLVLSRNTGDIEHRMYRELFTFINPGDVVVLNNTKVIRARLIATNEHKKQRELLLLEEHANTSWHTHRVLYRGKIRAGETLFVDTTPILVQEVLGDGIAVITSETNLLELANAHGSVPLPPYMHRDADNTDTERYQTVFAEQSGSVAAPTASLNFTPELEQEIRAKGAHIAYLTLHVGLGTFLPIRADNIEDHVMHSEYFEIPAETIRILQNAHSNSSKIVAVGTTVARTLEFAAQDICNYRLDLPGLSGLDGVQGNNENRTSRIDNTVSETRKQLTPQSAKSNSMISGYATDHAIETGKILAGEANIFIYPGYKFQLVDALLTNFHAPKSTVLMLAAAFAGWKNLQHAYDEAIKNDYAFLSYGDSMLIH